jgi:hypothetical protein
VLAELRLNQVGFHKYDPSKSEVLALVGPMTPALLVETGRLNEAASAVEIRKTD